jgi:hypothetical protein
MPTAFTIFLLRAGAENGGVKSLDVKLLSTLSARSIAGKYGTNSIALNLPMLLIAHLRPTANSEFADTNLSSVLFTDGKTITDTTLSSDGVKVLTAGEEPLPLSANAVGAPIVQANITAMAALAIRNIMEGDLIVFFTTFPLISNE